MESTHKLSIDDSVDFFEGLSFVFTGITNGVVKGDISVKFSDDSVVKQDYFVRNFLKTNVPYGMSHFPGIKYLQIDVTSVNKAEKSIEIKAGYIDRKDEYHPV